jgi:hypothetical protein
MSTYRDAFARVSGSCDAFAVARPPAGSNSKSVTHTTTKPEPTDADLGHWRNRWQVPAKHAHLARQQGALPLGDGTWLGYMKFPTSEQAERHARKYVAYNLANFDIRYLGPEFFPDY